MGYTEETKPQWKSFPSVFWFHGSLFGSTSHQTQLADIATARAKLLHDTQLDDFDGLGFFKLRSLFHWACQEPFQNPGILI